MTPDEFFRKIVELYFQSRITKFYSPRIKRGRSASISSDLEDLTAFFLQQNLSRERSFFVDQPMRFGRRPNGKIQTRYPDIVIQENDGEIAHLVDVKTDMGWNRNGLYEFCNNWNEIIDKVKGAETQFKEGDTKKWVSGVFSGDLTYHIVVITKENNGKTIERQIADVKARAFENVRVYFLSEGWHPNSYDKSIEEVMDLIRIDMSEFERLIKNIA